MDVLEYSSPIGIIKVTYSKKGIVSLIFLQEDYSVDNYRTHPCITQLDEYFRRIRQSFNMPLDLRGTDFQLKVWNQLMNIPYGKTITYQELAQQVGNPKTIRAAAHANGQNPVSIIVPCHRVIGSDGSLTGYAGGLWRKQWLLEHEQKEKQGKLFE